MTRRSFFGKVLVLLAALPFGCAGGRRGTMMSCDATGIRIV
jgi:hypothetical protein